MTDFTNLKKLPYMTKRMFIIENICKKRGVDLQYLFGLFNLYNNRNSGRWFWQKASFTGLLKTAYDNFNKKVESIVKDLKLGDQEKTVAQIEDAAEPLDKLLTSMEIQCEINRDYDSEHVKGFLDDNLRALINDSLKPFKKAS
ncbi:unnamed protein product [marine sediment metagenome]|uniref:Uncharacterized protein n=1 Tax=marine sediment metagenome TaxID=412755 RepID=X0WI23_9ZZZZ